MTEVSSSQAPSTGQIVKVCLAANVGGWIDYYDFFLSSFVAGTVWPVVFFPRTIPPPIALSLAVASFAIVYAARPVGAYVFGHLGDKLGRKPALAWTLISMGLGVLGIGIMPGYAVIGMLAPILVSIFRFIQGLGIGGEFGPSFTWVGEYASASKWRTFWVGVGQTVILIGKMTSSAATAIALAVFSQSDFVSYGWRIPYILGAVVAIVGIVIRVRLDESPLFRQMREKRQVVKFPASDVLKKHWKKSFGLAVIPLITVGTGVWIQAPYGLVYMDALKVNAAFAALSITIGTAIAVPSTILGCILGSIWSKKIVMYIGSVSAILVMFPYFWLIQTLDPLMIILAQTVFSVTTYLGASVQMPILIEQYPTQLRASGSGISIGITSIYTGIATGLILPVILAATGSVKDAWPEIAAGGVVMLVLVLIATLILKEPERAPLERIWSEKTSQ